MVKNELEVKYEKIRGMFKYETCHDEFDGFEIDAVLNREDAKFYVRITRGDAVIKFVQIGFAVDTVDVRVTRACTETSLTKQGTRTTCVQVE